MSDYNSPYHLTAEQQLADLQKHVQDHQARGELQFQKSVADFKKIGAERVRDATFNVACDRFDEKLGTRAREVAQFLFEQDNPHEILLHLDNNPHELENLKNLPAQRVITELGRISNRLDSSTRVPSGPEPAWRKTGSDAAQTVEASWHRDGADHIKSDREWNAAYDRHMAKRNAGKVVAMVGFAAPQPGSPEAWNRQIGSREFLSPAYHPAFELLVLEIHRLARSTDELTLPSVSAAGAWASAFSIYEQLKERELKAEQRANAEGAQAQNFEKRWNDYLTNRTTIIEGLRREIFDTTILADYLDLQPGDLDAPVVKETNRYGSNRRPNWEEVAERLDNAISYWHALSAEQKFVLRSQTTLRQLAALKERQKQYG